MKAKLFISAGEQVAVRVGPHFFGVRAPAMRELYSERHRIGWSVVYLPLGLRAFYRRDQVPIGGAR